MKRDWNLIRLILKKVQDDDHSDLDGYDHGTVAEHQRLLNEAGLIEGLEMAGGWMPWQTCRLTWQGHEFIESAQNEKVYHEAVMKAQGVGAISFEIIKTTIAEIAKRAMFGDG